MSERFKVVINNMYRLSLLVYMIISAPRERAIA